MQSGQSGLLGGGLGNGVQTLLGGVGQGLTGVGGAQQMMSSFGGQQQSGYGQQYGQQSAYGQQYGDSYGENVRDTCANQLFRGVAKGAVVAPAEGTADEATDPRAEPTTATDATTTDQSRVGSRWQPIRAAATATEPTEPPAQRVWGRVSLCVSLWGRVSICVSLWGRVFPLEH